MDALKHGCGDFRIEVVFRRSVYALGIETARELLAGLERRAESLPPAAATLRADLRAAISAHDAGPGEEAEGSRQPAAGSRQSDGSDRSDADDAPRCWACGRPGRRLPYDWRAAGQYICDDPRCVRRGIPAEAAEFEHGPNM